MSAAQPFVHLHVHTEFSLLDGLSKIDKLVARAKALNMGHLAISDHGAMHGVITFYKACVDAGIKPIIGMEGYLAKQDMRIHDATERQPYHLLLLARDETGYKNLLKIATAAQLEGFYNRPRIDKEFLAAHAQGLICTSGCLAAEIPRMISEGREEEARKQIGWYQDVFGKDNFFLELQYHDIPELLEVNRWLVENKDYAGVPLLATNDVHYVLQEDSDAHDTLLCIQTNALKSTENRMRMTDDSYYLRSQQEMWEIFGEVPEALENTLLIAQMCDVNLDKGGYHLPVFPVPRGFKPQSYLRYLTEHGLQWRFGEQASNPDIVARLDYELDVIHKMGFDTYFLIVWDLCQFARKADIWWNVRGSGAGSVVAYSLGITNIDPISNDLIFERFLNPGRQQMPDIDIDFPDDRRKEMIDYAMHKYGSEKVAAIITFGTLKARAAIKDVARALDWPLPAVNNLTRMVPQIPSRPVTLAECLSDDPEKAVPDLKKIYDDDEATRKLLDMAITVEGVARNAGTHAAGIIIGDQPLIEYLPLHRPMGESAVDQLTQFTMEVCEKIGLLKIDFLGLSTLTQMRKASDLIEKYHGVRYTMDNIPYKPDPDNPEVTRMVEKAFELIGQGETTGVFQLEGAGMTRMLVEMKPTTFEHIIAAISLFRPGPMELIPTYIRRMHGKEAVKYHHPGLESILKETYGICVYQEQIMQIAYELFGYSLGDADMMRRAVSKKKAKDLATHKQIFMDNGPKNGVPVEVAEKIFSEIEYFAQYGFNRCLTKDATVIDSRTGRLHTIGDFASGKIRLEQTLGCDIEKLRLVSCNVANIWENGIKPVYQLTTRLGRKIKATENHPFYTFSGWRTLGEISIGEKIAVPRRIPVEGNKEWADHEVIVLGHLLAEGNLCHPSGVYYYTNSEEQWRDYVSNLEKFENIAASTHRRRGNMHDVYGRRIVRSRPNSAMAWIEELGLRNATSYTKFIPDAVFGLSNRQIALLIARMWDGDGNIDEKKRSVYYATSSERMVHQLQHLFLRFGIISRLRRVEFKYKDGRIGYQLRIHGNENLRLFAETIGCYFVSALQREKLTRMVLSAPASSGTTDCVPVMVHEVIRRAKLERNITWKEVAVGAGVSISELEGTPSKSKSGYTHTIINHLANYFDNDELRRYASNDVYWDEVVSIEYVGEEMTYDLTIPDTHNFVANDIIVHNSHAADYAVLTCQTAFLKAHYPEEFYTALLTVNRDKSEDVRMFTADCRRFGIPVLPPDVNASDLDFLIEPLNELKEDGTQKRGIRYGMAAIKNVGEKAAQQIIEARNAGGPFHDIGDFCRRVDLRVVGKRAIESLIKVGAMDLFANRDQLLLSLDKIQGYSSDHHKAKDIGQISMFDSDDLTLPPVKPGNETPQREKLRWEKDLIGLYVSEHPLTARMDQIRLLPNIHYSETLRRSSETMHNRTVTIVGLVTAYRTIITKRGDTMAVVSLEDIQGNIDCVMFARTWAEAREMVEVDRVIIVMGKVDTGRGDVQILADRVSQNFEVTLLEGTPQYSKSGWNQIAPDWAYEPDSSDDMMISEDDALDSRELDDEDEIAPPMIAPPVMVAPSSVEPPMSLQRAGKDAANGHESPTTHELPGQKTNGTNGNNGNGHMPNTYEPAVEQPRDAEPILELNPDAPPRLLTITIQISTDREKERRRVNRIYRKLLEYPGNDKFCFRLISPDQRERLQPFDNDSTHFEAVADFLRQECGSDAIELIELD